MSELAPSRDDEMDMVELVSTTWERCRFALVTFMVVVGLGVFLSLRLTPHPSGIFKSKSVITFQASIALQAGWLNAAIAAQEANASPLGTARWPLDSKLVPLAVAAYKPNTLELVFHLT